MSDMNENIVTLYPQVTRAGQNRLLDLPNGIQEAVTHIGLGTVSYTPTANDTAAVGEVLRIPVVDSVSVGDNAIQFAAVANGWAGALTAIYGIFFYLGDGTLLAAYSSTEAEAVLKNGRSEELFYTLILDVIPADKLQVVSTQTYFQPGIKEFVVATLASQSSLSLNYIRLVVESENDKKLRADFMIEQSNKISQLKNDVDLKLAQQRDESNTAIISLLSTLVVLSREFMRNTVALETVV